MHTQSNCLFLNHPSGSSTECPEDQPICFPSTPCDEVESFFCGTNFDDASARCEIPCESGQSRTCPDGQGCFAYTLCSEYGTNAVPTPTLAPIPAAPVDSYFCGASFDEASSSCTFPCPGGRAEDCPGDLLCFASTPCNDKQSFFCGVTWAEAATSCTQPCESGLNSQCPDGTQCFGYTPCSKTESFYCGTSFEEASTSCEHPCPSGEDTQCPGLETCQKYTTCGDTTPIADGESPSGPGPGSYFCGVDFLDAATRCSLPCPTGSATECPVGEACFDSPCSSGGSFFCGSTWYDASSHCDVPCPSGLDDECPGDSKCFGYTPCTDTATFYCGFDFRDATETCNIPCPR